MNSQFNEENLGKTFKDAFENFEIKPQKLSWQDLSTKIPTEKPGGNWFSRAAIATISVAIIATATYFSLNHFKTTSTPAKSNSNGYKIQKPTIIEKIVESDGQENVVETGAPNQQETPRFVNNNVINESKTLSENSIYQIKPIRSAKVDLKTDEKPAIDTYPKDMMEGNSKGFFDDGITTDKSEDLENKDFKPEFSNDTLICPGERVELKVFGGESFVWDNSSTESSITVEPDQTSEYGVTVFDSKGNEIYHKFVIQIDNSCHEIAIPKSFTPNGDGKNDYFKVESSLITDFEIIIIDKMGTTVFHSKDINQGWDGLYKGVPQPTQNYVYIINYTSSNGLHKQAKGSVILIK